jgi:hypothetical protein
VALALADDEPAQLLRIGAAELVESIELRPGMVTVLWHSVMWQYLSADERARTLAAVEGLAAAATATAPFAHLRFERGPDPGPGQVWVHEVRLSMWPHGPDDGLLGTAPAHGVPVAWVAGP